jgi:hypothetical protein
MNQVPSRTLTEIDRLNYARETLEAFRAWWNTCPRHDDWWMVRIHSWLSERAEADPRIELAAPELLSALKSLIDASELSSQQDPSHALKTAKDLVSRLRNPDPTTEDARAWLKANGPVSDLGRGDAYYIHGGIFWFFRDVTGETGMLKWKRDTKTWSIVRIP